MSQEIHQISLTDLVLWTENPRDLINARAKDQDIVDRAIEDRSGKWHLSKLAREMGDHYDFSELPTVVYHGNTPVVYDGNRRVILGKIKHGLVAIKNVENIKLPDIPLKIPCNVCSKTIALKNVYRKHADSGSWQPLERDIFLHQHMGKEKSPFLILEESTKIVSQNPELNQRFVKEEIFREDILETLGFDVKTGRLRSIHDDNETSAILHDILDKVKTKKITTREHRGDVIGVLEKKNRKAIVENKHDSARYKLTNVSFVPEQNKETNKPQRQTRRVTLETELFGGKLFLKAGEVSNIYRDIMDLYNFYAGNKQKLSPSFPSLIRMSLRLLCESACSDKKMDHYLKTNFENAKKQLDQDDKTLLSNHNVTDSTIVQLLHTGAHNYKASSNFNQTLAMSIIIGKILTLTHGK